VIARARDESSKVPLDRPPAEISNVCYRIAAEMLGDDDLYREEKAAHNRAAMRLLPDMRRMLDESEDRLALAVRLAVVGNLLDLALVNPPTPEEILQRARSTTLAIDHSHQLVSDLKTMRELLYICDNAGEIVFDMLLAEELARATGAHTVFAVRGGPVMNDATMDDALEVGLDKVGRVVTTGSSYLGVSYEHSSPEFGDLLRNAGMVLAKGHANFETMPDGHPRTYHLLTAKCEPVGAELGVSVFDSVLWKRPSAVPT
jgi:uncharacterized protein with ATP-grasp and redox domains